MWQERRRTYNDDVGADLGAGLDSNEVLEVENDTDIDDGRDRDLDAGDDLVNVDGDVSIDIDVDRSVDCDGGMKISSSRSISTINVLFAMISKQCVFSSTKMARQALRPTRSWPTTESPVSATRTGLANANVANARRAKRIV